MKTLRQRKLKAARHAKAIADAEHYFINHEIPHEKVAYNMYRITISRGAFFFWPTTGRWSLERNDKSYPSYGVEDFFGRITNGKTTCT